MTVITVTPAQATNAPDPFSCTWNSTFGGQDYFWFKSGGTSSGTLTPLCFVNAGLIDLYLPNIWGVHSGNNAGMFLYQTLPTGTIWNRPFNKWEDDTNYYGLIEGLAIF